MLLTGEKKLKYHRFKDSQIHIVYAILNSDIASRCGTPYLQKSLNQQLTNHIRDHLPTLRDNLQKQLNSLEKIAREYEEFSAEDPAGRAKVFMQIIQQFRADFEKSIEGSGNTETDINTHELSGGAKINRIFHERFPFEMVKIQYEEKELRKEINIAIQNIYGVRLGLFTPDKAFEAIVKKKIAHMRDPAIKCVDLVVSELQNSIAILTECVARYPLLRAEIEKIIGVQIQQRAQACKSHIELIINCELAYMNTNHEDFVGFNTFDNTNDNNNQTHTQKQRLGNQVIRKGYLSMSTGKNFFGGGNRDTWFVLTSEHLTWYKDNSEKERKQMLQLEGLKLRDGDTSIMTRRTSFCLFSPDGRNIYKDNRTLELTCTDVDEAESWKAAFLRAGVFPEKRSSHDEVRHFLHYHRHCILLFLLLLCI